ncbi:MAG TPA: bifunctional riboflavin kinase/FAD synthetase [Actinomycetota bacterium]
MNSYPVGPVEVVRGLESLPLSSTPSVVTVGFFDGVHRGHQAVLATTAARAHERHARSVAVTFDRHPREILAPGTEPRLLTTVERKASLIEAAGIDVLVVLPFTSEFSRVTDEEFVADVLVRGLHCVHAVMGANFTFGFKATGTVETLPAMGAPFGMTAEGVPLMELEIGSPASPSRVVSSSSVREALAAGDLGWPHEALGRRFVLDGEVVSGHGRGKGLGYPTANLRTWPRLLLPGQGIYAGVADMDGGRYRAAIDVGTNPTFGVEPLHVEAFLLDFEGDDFRGAPISIEFWTRLRDEVKYDAVDELIVAIGHDVDRTRDVVPDEALV